MFVHTQCIKYSIFDCWLNLLCSFSPTLFSVGTAPGLLWTIFVVSRKLSLLLLVHLDDMNFTHRFPYRGQHLDL